MAESLLDAALAYQKQGYSVVPLQPGSKLPMIRWQDFSTRRATEEEICEWWKKEPRANIGIVTGRISNLIAVDVDTDRGGNAERIFELAPTELISQTGGGGYHILYKYDDTVSKNKVGKNGIDVRSNGGYIVAPPSLHASGDQYRWIKRGVPHKVTSQLVSYLSLSIVPDQKLTESPEKWLADALLGVGHGGRNDTCARLAGYYASKGIPKDVAIIMLENWDNNNEPPLGKEEVERTVISAYKTAYRNNPPPNPRSSNEEFGIINMTDYMIEYGENAVNWIIPDWLPEETIAFIASPPGTYKTWMLLDLAASVAGGTPFLGQYEVSNKGPVLMIQQEDHHGGLAERLGVIMNGKYHLLQAFDGPNFIVTTPPNIPLYFHPDRKLKFKDKIIMDKLEEVVEKIRPRLVIIDPLYSAAESDDFMAKSASDMFRLKEMRDKYHCSFVIAHHKKKNAEANSREGLWGSQFLNAFLETGWQIRSTGETSISVRRHFKVKKEFSELTINFNINTEKFPYKYEITTKETAGEVEMDIIELLQEMGEATIDELVSMIGAPKTTVSKRVKLLIKDKMVVEVPGKKFKLLESITQF